MESKLVSRTARKKRYAYGVAVLSAVAGVLIRLPLAPLLGDRVPYITFFLATAVSASFGGLGPGLLTTLLGAVLAGLFVVPPFGSLLLQSLGDYLGLLIFVGVGSFISYLAGRLRHASSHENALRLLFQQTLISIGDAVISTDDDSTVRLMNPVAERLTGWTEAEAKGRPLAEVFRIVSEGSDVPVQIPVAEIIRTGAVLGLANHTELISRSGQRIPIDDSGAPIRDQEGRVAGAVLVFRDVTARRRAELDLAAAERRSRNILSSITDAFILLDSDWRYADLNPAAAKVLGAPAEVLSGKQFWEHHAAALGTPVESLFRQAVAKQIPVHLEYLHLPWGRWFDISAYPSQEGLAVYFHDISQRKRSEAELLRLNEDLKQFTFAATHDIREPLRMIAVYVQMLQRNLGDQLDAQTLGYISRITGGVQRISRLIDGLLEFSRVGDAGSAEPSCVDSEAAFREALDDLKIAVDESKAQIVHEHLPQVIADNTHVGQLFQNLIGNALKYRHSDRSPRVQVSARRDGSQWIFAVRDNGIGIPREHQAEIFVPFKRLHGGEIAGAGIGLATCKRIVERYQGRIWVESNEGEGSTFYFSLSAAP